MFAFGWLCVRAASVVRRSARRHAAHGGSGVALGVAAAAVAIALHGCVDSFFAFTTTYVLMAVTLGLAVACDRMDTPHAHRV
jgi:threonine/homoserine efflux transporter RhtA